MKKNMIIGQSGGPTSVINSSLAGAIEYAINTPAHEAVMPVIPQEASEGEEK